MSLYDVAIEFLDRKMLLGSRQIRSQDRATQGNWDYRQECSKKNQNVISFARVVLSKHQVGWGIFSLIARAACGSSQDERRYN